MENTHTLGEWYILHDMIKCKWDDPIEGHNSAIICQMKYNPISNAQHIVKCVNAHDELVKGYKTLIYEYECALKLIAEAIGMTYSENDFVITNKKLLQKVTDTTPINQENENL